MRADATLTKEEPFVLTTVANGVATLTLNRPERFNPLSTEMIAAMQAELNAIAGNTSVRVLILAAEGKGFCAGHDLKEMRAHTDDRSLPYGDGPEFASTSVCAATSPPCARHAKTKQSSALFISFLSRKA